MLGTLAELMSINLKLLRKLTITKNLHLVTGTVYKTRLRKLLKVNHCAFVETLKLCNIHNFIPSRKFRIIKTTLRNSTKKRHLPAFTKRHLGSTGPAALALMTTTARLAVTAPDTSANTPAVLLPACYRCYLMIQHL